jgi:hypothetical protein
VCRPKLRRMAASHEAGANSAERACRRKLHRLLRANTGHSVPASWSKDARRRAPEMQIRHYIPAPQLIVGGAASMSNQQPGPTYVHSHDEAHAQNVR